MEETGVSLDLKSMMMDVPKNQGCVELEIFRKDAERYKREMDKELDALCDDMTDDESGDDSDGVSDSESEKKSDEDSHYINESSVGALNVYQTLPPNYGQSVETEIYKEQRNSIHNRSYDRNQEAENDHDADDDESVSPYNEHYTRPKGFMTNGHSDGASYENGVSEKSFSAYSHQNQRSDKFHSDSSFSRARSVQDKDGRSYSSDNFSYAQGDNFHLNESKLPDSRPSHQPTRTEELQDEFLKLQVLYDSTCNELESVKRAELGYREEAEQMIRNLERKQALIEGDKNRLSSNLQESQNLISDYKRENNVLLGKVNALELQLSTMIKTKDEALSKLSSYEVTISSLERQIRDLSGTESLTRLRDQQDKMFEDMKLRHQREVLKYKEIIDDLQSKLNTKILDAENWKSDNAELEQKLQVLQMEKISQFNKMTTELENSQKRFQKLIESGNFEEISLLKLQVQRLEEDKFKYESENIALKAEINSLKAELNASEALQKLAFTSKSQNPSPERHKGLNLQTELENSLKNVRNLRAEKQSLKKQLKETEKGLETVTENSKMFESRCIESENKVKKLEEQLFKLISDESTSNHSLKQRCKSLDEELSRVKIKLSEASDRYNKLCQNEKILSETNLKLQNTISDMLQRHSEEKIKAVEDCREKYLEIHESSLKKEKLKIMHQTEAEEKELCMKYENKIAEMEREVSSLKNKLYDSKAEFLSLYEENKVLQAQLDNISKPKEREEIEREVQQIYESKFNKMKESLVAQSKEQVEKNFNEELEKAQMKWTVEKMEVVKEYVENAKKQLDERFQNCLQKEQELMHKKLESERQMLHKQYEELTNAFKVQLEEEKKQLKLERDQSDQLKHTKELEEQRKSHEHEMVSLKQMYENKISDMEKEIGNLQKMSELLNSRTRVTEELQRRNNCLNIEQDLWQKEKGMYVSKELNWQDSEKKLLEKIQKYQRYINRSEKRFKEKQASLLSQISNLEDKLSEKQSEIASVKEKFEQDMLDFGEKFKSKVKNSSCQTLHEMVPKESLQDMQEQFFNCLRNISTGIREFAIESKKRHAKQLEASLHHYHQQISAKSLQDLSEVARTFTPTFVVPHSTQKKPSVISSRGTFLSTPGFPTPRNVNFKTSTPDLLTSNHDPKGRSGLLRNNKYSSITSMNDTRAKSLYAANPVSNTMWWAGRNELKGNEGKDIINSVLNHELSKKNTFEYDSEKPNSDAQLRFEDVSYDFPSFTDGFNNLPGYSFPPSSNESESLQNSYPVKLPRN